MKIFKKISLVYTLQVLAVILLFYNAGSSPGKETNVSAKNTVLLLKLKKDSASTGQTNDLWKINTGKSK